MQIYAKLQDFDKAAKYYLLNWKRREAEDIQPNKETIDGLLFLSEYFRDNGLLNEAEYYANKLLDCPGRQEEARSILKEISSLNYHQRYQKGING